MIDKIKRFIRENALLECGDTVVCGFSGGADSTALLFALYELREELDINVEAVHVNHCLRDVESDRDEAFCQAICDRKLYIPFTAVSCDVRGFAKEHSLSLEEAARKLRYDVFADVSKGKKLATAHNANDNLETMLLNTIRGTALKGIAGIPALRGNIIRPLLAVSRAEIEEYLAKKRQSYVTDSTNLSDDYTRNRIRHSVVPMMTELNPSLIGTSVRTMNVLRSENEFIEAEVEKALGECREGNKLIRLSRFHEIIAQRCIARLLADNSLPYSYDRIRKVCSLLETGGKLSISGDIYIICEEGSVELKKIPSEGIHETVTKELIIGENSLYPNIIFTCELIQCDDLKKFDAVHKKLTYYELDYDKIKGRALLRNRRYGDRIRLAGRDFYSSVKKLINETVPQELRRSLHFIEDDEGTVFAECIGVAERVLPDENTRSLLRISVVR